jgi:hypothetical protein
MRTTLTLAITGLAAASPAVATTLDISVEVPRLNVAEYHRPYVALWVEDGQGQHVRNLSVWYQQTANAEGHGTKWLPDLRQWWRKSGRTLTVPVDGITGPTKPVGKHALSFNDTQPQLRGLAAGQYTLVVESVREVGGREMLRIPFSWKTGTTLTGKAQGSSELGEVRLAVRP